MSITLIDYSLMPQPDVIELLDYEIILAELKADLLLRESTLTAVVLESDPVGKILEAVAFRELNYRQRVNDAARARMLPFAAGADLDYLGIDHDVLRYVISAGDANAVPPVAPVLESDSSFRARIILAISAKTTAGALNSYRFFTRSSDPDVKDESVVSLNPGIVTVTVLSASGDGTASLSLLGVVTSALNADNVRPLTDQVDIQSVAIIPLTLTAEITLLPNLDSVEVQARALTAINTFLFAQHMIGHDITLAAIHAALMVAGVQNVAITAPATDVVVDDVSAAWCASPTITVAAQPAL